MMFDTSTCIALRRVVRHLVVQVRPEQKEGLTDEGNLRTPSGRLVLTHRVSACSYERWYELMPPSRMIA